MKIKKEIIDLTPWIRAKDLDVVTFKRTDLNREAIKGCVGTVFDIGPESKDTYVVSTACGNVWDFHRSEFRLATDEDLMRHREIERKKAERARKHGAQVDYNLRIPQFPGDPKI